MVEEMKQYLLPLNALQDDKRYVMNFCKKIEYLDSIRQRLYEVTGMDVSSGYGDVNSKICVVFNSETKFKEFRQAIQNVLTIFGTEFWELYITYINKVDMDYPKKYEMVASELSAVRPSLLYVIDKDRGEYDRIIDSLKMLNVPVPEKHFFVDIAEMCSSDEAVRQGLWKVLRYFINYKTFDIKE